MLTCANAVCEKVSPASIAKAIINARIVFIDFMIRPFARQSLAATFHLNPSVPELGGCGASI